MARRRGGSPAQASAALRSPALCDRATCSPRVGQAAGRTDTTPRAPTPSLPLLYVADTAPSLKKLYHQSGIALAALVPLAIFQQQGDALGRVVDAGLALAVPLHGHIAMNYVVTDYVPKSVAGAARWGVLGASALTFAGLAKLAIAGPGVTPTVKALWTKKGGAKAEEKGKA